MDLSVFSISLRGNIPILHCKINIKQINIAMKKLLLTMLLCVCAGTAFADFRQEYDTNRNFWNLGKIESGYPEGVGTKLTEHVGNDTHKHEVWGATTEIKVPETGDVIVTFSYQGWSGSTDATKILGVDIINSSGTVISSSSVSNIKLLRLRSLI